MKHNRSEYVAHRALAEATRVPVRTLYVRKAKRERARELRARILAHAAVAAVMLCLFIGCTN
jgi:hypothetical protein